MRLQEVPAERGEVGPVAERARCDRHELAIRRQQPGGQGEEGGIEVGDLDPLGLEEPHVLGVSGELDVGRVLNRVGEALLATRHRAEAPLDEVQGDDLVHNLFVQRPRFVGCLLNGPFEGGDHLGIGFDCGDFDPLDCFGSGGRFDTRDEQSTMAGARVQQLHGGRLESK
jgi:hypothetical protein